MSSPGHFKIPGHSGTAIKHRKGFVKRKELLQHKQRIDGAAAVHKNGYYERRTNQSSRIVIKMVWLVLILAGITSVGLLINSIVANGMAYHQENWQIQSKNQKSKEAFYPYRIRDAYLYLEAGNLKAAQYEFELALSINPNGKKAIIGMNQTLKTQCQQLQINCDAAKEYANYMKAKGW